MPSRAASVAATPACPQSWAAFTKFGRPPLSTVSAYDPAILSVRTPARALPARRCCAFFGAPSIGAEMCMPPTPLPVCAGAFFNLIADHLSHNRVNEAVSCAFSTLGVKLLPMPSPARR